MAFDHPQYSIAMSSADSLVTLVDSLQSGMRDPKDATPLIVQLVRDDVSLAGRTLRALNSLLREHQPLHSRTMCDRCDMLIWAVGECERIVAATLPKISDEP